MTHPEPGLDGLADLDTGSAYVRAREAAYLNALISLGVDGFRWDAAKEMDPADIAGIESLLSAPVFSYQEVPWGAGQPVTPELMSRTATSRHRSVRRSRPDCRPASTAT